MLKSISLENYKCFRDKTDIEIAPLTVLCGVNSSGKSSILKSLLMLKQSYEDNSVSNTMLFNGKYIDNGTYKEILNENHTEEYFTIENSFIIEKNKGTEKDNRTLRDLNRLYYYKNKFYKFIISYSISISAWGNSLYSNIIRKIDISISGFSSEDEVKSSISLKKNKNKYSIFGIQIPDVSGKLGDFTIKNAICYFNNMTLNSVYENNMDEQTKLYIPTLVSLFNIIPYQYMQIQYIAPLRENPRRRYIADKRVNDVGVSGEDTPLLLKRLYERNYKKVKAPISEDCYIPSESIITSDSFINFVNSWMRYMELGNLNLDLKQKELIKVTINNKNIADVGFGVSQALPIITEGLYLSPDQTLLLEQPEIHLHPKMQMRMADFLLSLANFNKTIIVETHSDHFVNRVIRRYMEDENIRNKIKIYFIDKDCNGVSSVFPIEIDKVDGAICENENFFYQFSSETEKIIDIGYKNLQNQENVK